MERNILLANFYIDHMLPWYFRSARFNRNPKLILCASIIRKRTTSKHLKITLLGWDCDSGIQRLPGMLKALGLVPSPTK